MSPGFGSLRGGLGLYLPLLLQCIDCCSALQGRYSPGELVQILGIQNTEWGGADHMGSVASPGFLLMTHCFPFLAFQERCDQNPD